MYIEFFFFFYEDLKDIIKNRAGMFGPETNIIPKYCRQRRHAHSAWGGGGSVPHQNFGVRQYTCEMPNPFTVTFNFRLKKNSNPFNLGRVQFCSL